MTKKINENQLRSMIRESLKESMGDDVIRTLFGNNGPETKELFSKMDDAFHSRGINAYVSKFFSNEEQVLISFRAKDGEKIDKAAIKEIMKKFGYGDYRGGGIDWMNFYRDENYAENLFENNEEANIKDMKPIKINEVDLRKVVAESVKKHLAEMRDVFGHGDFEFGTNPSNFEKGEYPGADAKGKNYFTKNGIVNCAWNDMEGESTRAWLTTTFLGHRHLALKLGGRWCTALKKSFFNHYTVDDHCILVVVEDKRSGLIALLQIGEDGIRMAYDKDDREVPKEELDKLARFQMTFRGKSAFNWMFEKTEKMCREEDEFFASKTSKTYERLRENKKSGIKEENTFGLTRRDNRESEVMTDYNAALNLIMGRLSNMGYEVKNPYVKADIESFLKHSFEESGNVNIKQFTKSMAEYLKDHYSHFDGAVNLYESRTAKYEGKKNNKKVIKK